MNKNFEHATAEHCQKLRGLHMNSPEADAICNEVNWDGTWPVVDTDGVYSGQIAEWNNDVVLVSCDAETGRLIEGCNAAINADDLGWEVLDDRFGNDGGPFSASTIIEWGEEEGIPCRINGAEIIAYDNTIVARVRWTDAD